MVNYWHAAYGPFRVVMMKDTGYINATNLCSSGGKEYKDWTRNNTARELIESVSKKLNKVQASESIHGHFEDARSLLQIAEGRILPSVISPFKLFQRNFWYS